MVQFCPPLPVTYSVACSFLFLFSMREINLLPFYCISRNLAVTPLKVVHVFNSLWLIKLSLNSSWRYPFGEENFTFYAPEKLWNTFKGSQSRQSHYHVFPPGRTDGRWETTYLNKPFLVYTFVVLSSGPRPRIREDD